MDDKTLVELSRPALKQDHTQDCPMRSADCTCGHDDRIWNIARISLDRIEALEAALRIEIWNGLKRNGMSDDAATAMVKERMAALESKP